MNTAEIKMVRDKFFTFLRDNNMLIHHSGREFQYCCMQYTSFTQSNHIIMSMTEQYDPY